MTAKTDSAKTDKVRRRRRRRAVLVPLATVGVAVWAVRRRLTEANGPADGWHTLPPAPRPAPPPPAVPEVAEPPVPRAARGASPSLADRAAAAAAAVEMPARPEPDGALPALADGSSPDADYTIKGKAATKAFHLPGGAYYTRTRADVWFRTADDARAAGFTERVRRQG